MKAVLITVVILAWTPMALGETGSCKIQEELLTFGSNDSYDGVTNGSDVIYTSVTLGSKNLYRIDSHYVEHGVAVHYGDQHHADVDGNKVVYVDDELGYNNLWVHEIDTGASYPVTFESSDNYSPAISGDYVAYVEEVNSAYEIRYTDLVTFMPYYVTRNNYDELNFSLDGGLVAWSIYEGGTANLYATEIGGGTFTIAADSAAHETGPSIDGDRVAYLCNTAIDIYDRATGLTTRVLEEDTHMKRNLHLEGNVVYWSDKRNGNQNTDVFMLDLETGRVHQLTSDSHHQGLTDAFQNQIIYTDSRLGNKNVWRTTWEFNTLPAADAGLDQLVDLGQIVELAGGATDDDDDEITSWLWAIESAPDGSIATLLDPTTAGASFTPDLPGEYVFSLLAGDDWDNSLPDFVTVTVTPEPATLSMLALGGLAMLRRRRRIPHSQIRS
jgi:hypothetical protein